MQVFEAIMSCTFSLPQCFARFRGQCYSCFPGLSVMHVGSEGSLKV